MKYILSIAVLTIFLIGCADTPPRPEPVMTQAQHDVVNAESVALKAQKAAQIGSTGNVLHYYCTTHPSIGGDAQGTCSECGQALTHNQAYHNTPSAPATNTTVPTPTATGSPTEAAPATNAAGVYHYTCPNGCSGGAGAQIACSTCGSQLAHNQAYHN